MTAKNSGALRSRFPTAGGAVPPSDITALRRKAYGQGLLVIDLRSPDFKAQPWAIAILDWYNRRMMGAQ